MKKKNPKVIRYRKPVHINIGVIIFLFIFIYLAYSVVSYLTQERLQIYEVGEASSLSQDDTYTGLILREENVTNTEQTGFVNFYIREGSRAAVDDVVYSMDENGQFTELLSTSSSTESRLSQENMTELKTSLSSFVASYDSMKFYRTYELKYDLENRLLSFISTNSMEDLENLGIDTDYFHTLRAVQSGVIEYYVDGFEALTPNEITVDHFKRSNYNKNSIRSGDLLESGAPVYKTISSEQWSILISLDRDTAAAYNDLTSVSVTFPEKDLSTVVNFELISGADGNPYGKLSLGRYMVQYAGQRYMDVVLHQDQITGLKIPKSAVISSEFYTIPKDYLTTGGNSNSSGFYQEVYTASGTSVEFISPTIYYASETDYYVSMDEVVAGTVLVLPDESGNNYSVSSTASVSGVYNVNKGYAVFKAIEILDENSDYYIVRKGMDYGLTVYDHILLDGTLGSPGKMIY